MDKPKKSRRRIRQIVTEESIAAVARDLNWRLNIIDQRQPRPKTNAERENRHAILREAARKAMLGALAYLKVRDRATFIALRTGCEEYASSHIRGNNIPYIPKKRGLHEDWFIRMENMSLLAAHRDLKKRLRNAFRTLPRRVRRRVENEDRKDRLESGDERRTRRIADLADAVYASVKSFVDDDIRRNEDQLDAESRTVFRARMTIAPRVVQTWVRKCRAPAELSRRILAQAFGVAPRHIKERLAIAARQEREDRERA